HDCRAGPAGCGARAVERGRDYGPAHVLEGAQWDQLPAAGTLGFPATYKRREPFGGAGDTAADAGAATRPSGKLLAQMGLETVRQSKAYMLSGGERRRLEIARSLTLQPSFILLDEPFSGIDPLTVKDLQDLIRDLSRSGIGALITDHNVRETLTVTDRAYIVNHGKIMAKGTPQELSNDPEVRRVYLGDNFRLN